MRSLLAVLLLSLGLSGCGVLGVVFEYEHEFWLDTDGSGRVDVTGRPELWTAFKGIGRPGEPASVTPELVEQVFEAAGFEVRRVRRVHRRGHDYVYVDARFDDVNRLAGTAAFPDLELSLRPDGEERLVLDGRWQRPPAFAARQPPVSIEADALMAVRFHLPAKIYGHRNAFDGVQRGNIVGWRQSVSQALAGGVLELGAEMDRRSILWSTVTLFGTAIVIGLGILAGAVAWVVRKGRRQRSAPGGHPR